MTKNNFGLSVTGKVAAALTLAFVLAEGALAAGITAAQGGNGPQVGVAGNGAAVVNIVAPSAAGVSHNQYQDFNVGKPGAVFNNALQGGQSQLAGFLAANPQLNGAQASVILNEVVSRNPSLLLGKQEVFGKAADYVLANPNGIACNGCGFINIPRASLLVGNAVLENGAIRSLQAAGNGNALSIAGAGASGVSVLDLIAPRIDVRANVQATDAIRARAGFNTVDYASGQIVSTAAAPQGVGPLDSYFLGAMQAGRINIISTAAGAGVNVAGSVRGTDEATIRASGKLALEAAQVSGKQLALAGDSVDIRGRVDTASSQSSQHDESWFIWKTGESDSKTSSEIQSVKRASLHGDDVSIVAGGEARLAAVDVGGGKVSVAAGSVTLDGQLAESRESSSSHNWKNSWAYNQDKSAVTQQQSATRIKASGDVSLSAGAGDVTIKGGSVAADRQLKISAAGKVRLQGLVESDSSSDVGNRKNDTAALETGSWNHQSSQQRLVQAQLRAGQNLGIAAGGDIDAQAARLQAGGDAVISAGGKASLAAQQTANSRQQRNDQTYWGGIGGGGNRDNSQSATVNTGSDLSAGGKLFLNGDDGIAINGSRAKGEQGAYAQARAGGVVIDSAIDLAQTRTDQRSGTAFNITSSASKGSSSAQSVVGAELKSDADLQILSAGDVAVVGSLVKAAQALDISAVGDVKVASQAAAQDENSQDSALNWKGIGRETGDKQYRGGIGIEHTASSVERHDVNQTGATLSGGSVSVKAGNDVAVSGSRLEATRGDASLSGQNVSLTAADNTSQTASSKTVSGGGIYVDAGLDKTGVGVEFGQNHSQGKSQSSQAQASQIDAAGNLTVTAGNGMGDIRNQGTQIKAGGDAALNGGEIRNQAARNTQSSESSGYHWGVEVGVNADYSGITRPLVEAGKNVASGNVVGAAQQAGNLGAANLGVDLGVKAGSSEASANSSQALATSIVGGSVSVNAAGALKDEATRYQADKGGVAIAADSHQLSAAANTSSESSRTTEASVGVRVYTTTGEDINVKANGSGSTTQTGNAQSQAVTGSIRAADGAKVAVGNDVVYQGVNIDAGTGKAVIDAGGKIALNQADTTASSQKDVFSGSAGLTVNTSPIDGGKQAGGSGNAAFGKQSQQAASSQAVAGEIKAAGGIELKSGGDLTVQGGKLASAGDVSLAADGKVKLAAAMSESASSASEWGFNVKAGGSSSDGAAKSSNGFNVGGGFNVAGNNAADSQAVGVTVSAGAQAAIRADGAAKDAIHAEGAQISAKDVKLGAASGGVTLESAQSASRHDNWGVAANLGGGKNHSVAKENGQPKADGASSTRDIGGGFNVKVDQQDRLSNGNAVIAGERVELNVDRDLTLAGANIQAGQVSGKVEGNLQATSRQDRDNSTQVGVGLNVNSSTAKDPSLIDKGAKLAGPLADKAKEKGVELVNQAADKVEEKYNSFAFRKGLKEDTTQPVSFSVKDEKVTLPEQPTSGEAKSGVIDTLARKGGNTLKDKLLNPQDKGTQISGKVDVTVKTDDSVGAVSGISGKQGVDLQVGGKVQLTGAQLQSDGKVSLGDAKVETADIATHRYVGAGGVNLDGTPAALVQQAISDVGAGKAPLIKAERDNQTQTVRGGIQSGN